MVGIGDAAVDDGGTDIRLDAEEAAGIGKPVGLDDHAEVKQIDAPGLIGDKAGSRWHGRRCRERVAAAGGQDVAGTGKKVANGDEVEG